jgi:uncharacterized protein with HEPN domain
MYSSHTVLAVLAARENIALIRTWASGRALEDLRSDTKVRCAIERAFIALDPALRDIPSEIVAAHELPARPVAGFRNALAHTYEDILDERVILTIDESLPELYEKLTLILEQNSQLR